MKVIKVKGCSTCPYSKTVNRELHCVTKGTVIFKLEGLSDVKKCEKLDRIIPDWCPLEDG